MSTHDRAVVLAGSLGAMFSLFGCALLLVGFIEAGVVFVYIGVGGAIVMLGLIALSVFNG